MRYAFLACALIAFAGSGDAAGGEIRWRPLCEPGVGGAIVSVQVSPHDVRHVLAGGDMLGTGVSFDGGESWSRTGTIATNGWTSESVEGANIVQAFWGAKPAGGKEPRQVRLVAEGAGWFSSMGVGRR